VTPWATWPVMPAWTLISVVVLVRRAHLFEMHACDGAIAALEQAVLEFRNRGSLS
jgi:hypothetical protein